MGTPGDLSSQKIPELCELVNIMADLQSIIAKAYMKLVYTETLPISIISSSEEPL